MFPYATPDDLLLFLGSTVLILEQYFPVIICWSGLTSANDVWLLLLMVHPQYIVATNTLIGTCAQIICKVINLGSPSPSVSTGTCLKPSPSCVLSSGHTGYLADAGGPPTSLGTAPLPLPSALAVLFCSTVTLQAAAHATIL